MLVDRKFPTFEAAAPLKALLFANTDWYLYNFRLPLARSLRERGYEVVLISPPGEFVPRLLEAGFRWIEFRMARKSLDPLGELVTLGRVVRLYQREQPDLVHHFTIKCVLYGGIAARLTRTRAIVSAVTGMGYVFSTENLTNRLLRPFLAILYRLALRRSRVIFQNPDDLDTFLRRGLVCPDQSHLIRGSGIDIDYFRPAEFARSAPATVLMVARLLKEKGVQEFVEAASIVRQTFAPETRFLVAGDVDPGNPSSISEKQINLWGAAGDVIFLGHRSDVRDLMRSSDLMVLPSYYREGTPRSLLEAAACGLPLIAADVAGCREAVVRADH
jgi:glycosyltransferase involved in cell wall biosynthesis